MSDDPNLGPVVTPRQPKAASKRVLLMIGLSIALALVLVVAVGLVFLIAA